MRILVLFTGLLFYVATAIAASHTTTQTITYGGSHYKYYVYAPANFNAAAPPPALMLIHGAHGDGRDMLDLWKPLADKQGILLVAPTFPLDEKFEATVPQLYPLLMNTVKQTWNFDPRRVYIFGYSGGGYSVYDAATLNSDYFAAAGVFACGITPGYDGIVKQAKRKTPVAIYIGDDDQQMTVSLSRRTRDLLKANGFPVHYVEMPHQDHNYPAISAQINQDVWNYFTSRR